HQLGGLGESWPAEITGKLLQAEDDEPTTEHDPQREGGGVTPPFQHLILTSFTRLQHVDLDFLWPDLFRLREFHFEHPVAVGGRHSPRLHVHWQLDGALELPVGALHVMVVVVAQLLVELALTLHREQIASNRKRYFLLPNTRQLEIQDEIVLRLVHTRRLTGIYFREGGLICVWQQGAEAEVRTPSRDFSNEI